MTIDERVNEIMERCPVLLSGDVNGNRNFLRNALLGVARDQRHTCAEAVNAASLGNTGAEARLSDRIYQAVMNAQLD